MRKKSRHADAAPLRCCWPHPQTQSQKRVNKKTWRKKLHTHAHTHIDSAPPPPLPLLACCAAANHRICLRIARQKQHNENVDSSARKNEKKRARRSFCAIFATHTHTNTHSIKWPSPRLLVLSRSHTLPRLRSFTMCFVHFGSRSLSLSLALDADCAAWHIFFCPSFCLTFSTVLLIYAA